MPATSSTSRTPCSCQLKNVIIIRPKTINRTREEIRLPKFTLSIDSHGRLSQLSENLDTYSPDEGREIGSGGACRCACALADGRGEGRPTMVWCADQGDTEGGVRLRRQCLVLEAWNRRSWPQSPHAHHQHSHHTPLPIHEVASSSLPSLGAGQGKEEHDCRTRATDLTPSPPSMSLERLASLPRRIPSQA